MTATSLDDLQALMDSRLAAAGLAVAPRVQRRDVAEQAALSYGQRYVWAHHQLSPDAVAYNMCLAITFRGEVDDAALRRAFEFLPTRHEVLRTTYHSDSEGNPYQRIHAELAPRIASEDLRGQALPAERLAQVCADAATEAFDLTTDSSLRVTFVRMSDIEVVAVMVVQHIAWDGMTMPALAPDIEAAYRHFRDASPLPEPLTLQVGDYAEAEQAAEINAADEEYWAQQFATAPPRLALPMHGAVGSERGSRADRTLSSAADAGLRRLAAELSVTPYAVFLTTYYLALRTMTGSADIAIGTTVANRDEPGMDKLIANFSNTLALRISPNDDAVPTFAALARHVASVITDGFAHKQYPFERLARSAGAERIFDTLVLFLNQSIAGPQLPGAQTSWELIDNGAALLPIAAEVFHHDDRTDVQITYQTDVFDTDTVARLHDYLDRLLADTASQTTLRALTGLSSGDADNVFRWGTGPRAEISPSTLDAMIADSCRNHPDELAVIDEYNRLTYRDFDSHVDRLAWLLHGQGVRSGDTVAVIAERGAWLPMIAAAILRSGAVYLPINADQPIARISMMLDDSAPRAVIGSTRNRHEALDTIDDQRVVELWGETGFATIAAFGDEPFRPARPVHPLDAAYLVYTSGTTGIPKAVVNTHGSVASHIQWLWEFFGAGRERVLQKAPIGFDVGVAEIFNALTNGSAVVMPPADFSPADVDALAERIAADGVTMLSLVPSVLRALLEVKDAAAGDFPDLSSMRYLLLGGEAVLSSLVEQARTAFGPQAVVVGLYGPTEAAMDLMYEDFDGVVETGNALIGRPEANTDVYVLDHKLRPVAPGVTGELYLAGVQLARGYHDRAPLTSASFVACPFGEDAGRRMYRTGDVVRWNQLGRMEYLGRAGDQVKIRGNRIELGEVESAMLAVAGVGAAVPVAVEQRGGTALVAYYTADTEDEPESADVRRERIRFELANRLPDYMIPSALIELAEIPLTANGKVDRSRLPAAAVAETGAGSGRELAGDAEQQLAEVLRDVLDMPGDADLRAEDDFLNLGGDSIVAIRLVAQLKRRGYRLTTADVFAHRTVAGMASALEPVDTAAGAARDAETGWSPLSPLGRTLTEQGGDYASFSLATALVTPNDATVERLSSALQDLLGAHPTLGARLGHDDAGSLGYVIGTTEPVALDVIDVGPDEWTGVVVREVLDREVHRQSRELDPDSGVMLRCSWIRNSESNAGRLLLVAHHLVIDGVSWRILHDDLAAVWAGGAPSVEVTSSTRWNRLQHKTDRPAAESVRRVLGTSRAFDRRIDTVGTVSEVTTSLSGADLSDVMSRATEAFGCEFVDLQLAALVRAVAAESTDVVEVPVVTESHGRDELADTDVSATVGWFTQADLLRIPVGELDTVVRSAKEASLQRDSASAARLSTTPEVVFNYMGRFAVAGEASDADARDWQTAPEFGYLGGYADDSVPAPAALDVNSVLLTDAVGGARLDVSVRYPTGLIDTDTATRIADRWRTELTCIADAVRSDGRRRLSPADVVADGLTIADIDRLVERFGQLDDVLPLSPLQSGLYFTALASGGRDVYNVQTVITVGGDVDIERLSTAMDAVIDAHPNLAIAVALTDSGVPVGAVRAQRPPVPVTRVTDHRGSVADFLATDQRHQFAMGSPMIRLSVLTDATDLGAGNSVIVLTSHHILTDGWSGQLLPLEIFRRYAGVAVEATVDVYPEFLARTQADSSQARAVWEEYLADAGSCLVAPDRQATDADQAATELIGIPSDVTDALAVVAKEVGVTVNRLYQLAWAATINQLTGAADAVFGEVVSGRPADLEGADQSIGCYANTIPVAMSVPASATWRAVLTDIGRKSLPLLGHEQFPLTTAHQIVGTRRMFDTMFVFQSYPAETEPLRAALTEGGLELITTDGGGATDNALLVMVFPEGAVLSQAGSREMSDAAVQVSLTYDTGEFDDVEAQLIGRMMSQALRAMATTPDARVGESLGLTDDDVAELEARRMWQN